MARRDWYCEDVLSGKLDVDRVYEDECVLAFHHPRPVSEIHVVVVPKAHVKGLMDEAALDGDLLSSMMRAIQQTAKSTGLLNGRGFYFRANAAASGVSPHMHWHVIGPGAGADWPKNKRSKEQTEEIPNGSYKETRKGCCKSSSENTMQSEVDPKGQILRR